MTITMATIRGAAALGEAGARQTREAAKAQASRALARAEDHQAVRPRVRTARASIVPQDLSSANDIIPAGWVLDQVHKVLTHWGRWPSPESADIATLYIALTYMRDITGRPLVNTLPRLFFIAEMGSGKTRLMKLIRAMSYKSTKIVKAPVTAPGLRDALAAQMTIFMDELDRQIGNGRGHQDVQSLISAYEADTGSLNGRNGGLNQQEIFGPMVLAAKSKILTSTGGWVDDLFQRSFIISPKEHTDRNDPIPDLDDRFEKMTEDLRALLSMWAEAVAREMSEDDERKLWPIHDMPQELTSRMREISQPLLAVADLAVDPKVIAEHGQDIRWAIRGRKAVRMVLRKISGDTDELMQRVAERIAALDPEESEEF